MVSLIVSSRYALVLAAFVFIAAAAASSASASASAFGTPTATSASTRRHLLRFQRRLSSSSSASSVPSFSDRLSPIVFPSESSQPHHQRHRIYHNHFASAFRLYASNNSDASTSAATATARRCTPQQPPFSLPTALFLAGLAFDAYTEPPPNSSRWERGSSGLNVAFLSSAYTRSLYRGIIEVRPLRASDLPDEDDAAESLITGNGVDAALLVSVVEGAWTTDVQKLEREQYHNGVLDLAGCAHVGRSSTAWSNVDSNKAKRNKAKGGSGAYHIKSSWGRGGQAVWEDDPPFYLYVQDPKTARLVFTLFDEDVVGGGQPIGSAHRKLIELLPSVRTNDNASSIDTSGSSNAESSAAVISNLKSQVIAQLQQSGKLTEAIRIQTNPETGEEETIIDEDIIMQAMNESVGSGTVASIKMTSKPRKKDKGGQRAIGMAAGAMIAGPAGAAVGGILASMYEGEVRGKVEVNLKYTPIPQVDLLKWKEGALRQRYKVKGGLPGVDWGELYEKHVGQKISSTNSDDRIAGTDLEFCCFVTHDSTGCSCAIYRSLERKLICISFRGTCAPVDLITDATITQSAWVEGEDVENTETVKVHSGFRNSLNSISRRLKELVLAAVSPGEDLSDYDVLVTGHSLGGALATCFVMDVAEYGMDAGRGLPQLAPSEAWWNSIASTLAGKKVSLGSSSPPPPRPKSLKMYNFGSPRVGNDAFCQKFDSMIESGRINESYRIVNDQDVVTRTPRTVNALVLGNIGYEHCGPTVLITELAYQMSNDNNNVNDRDILWIEGQSDDRPCPVRDGNALSDPLGSGSLLGDIMTSWQDDVDDSSNTDERTSSSSSPFNLAKLGNIAGKVTGRLQQLSAEDLGSIVGIDKQFTRREMKFIQSILSGDGLSHHMEDKYYQGMGMCCGFAALPGQELMTLDEFSASSTITSSSSDGSST